MPLAEWTASELPNPRAARHLARLLNPAPVFAAHTPEAGDRAVVERYIANRFAAAHGAHVHDFMPVLLTMGCAGRISAAAGIRAAARRTLFLEQYLANPVETAVAEVAGMPVGRSRIVEIGNLVATQGGSSYLLFLLLTAILGQAGFEWVVFTATPQVRKALDTLGLRVDVLCAADPSRLTHGTAAEWGRYYASGPVVVAGKVADAMAVLHRRPLYAGVLSLYRAAIAELALVVVRESFRRGTCTFAA
ncbi:MAG: thermostable hemolysin [Xanthomonadales bacterium]|nr:thermostable hemolysin [Xanthomonadales bacterium]